MTDAPLAGIKVLDFSTLLPGPLATLILAEAGAEVIKLERPGQGEEMRLGEPKWGNESVNFALLNRGKKSIAVDLKDAGQRAALEPLLAETDVLVEQFRPGVMDRLGLGYDAVKAVNPGIVYCSITGYGATGPKAQAAGHDLNYMGDSGLLSLGMGTPASPVLPPALIADIGGGTYPAVVNILLALMRRERGGGGTHLDIAMTDNLFTFAFWAIGAGHAAGIWHGSGDGPLTGGSPRYQLYPTRDGRLAAVAALEDRFWSVFCRLLGVSPDAGIADIGAVIAARPAAHWRELFAGEDCASTVVATLEEAMGDPQFTGRGVFDPVLENESGARMPALPVPVAPEFRAPTGEARAAPALGADNREYLRGENISGDD